MATFKKAFLKSIFDKINNIIYILIYTSCVLSPRGCNIIPLMTEGPYETLWTLTKDRSFVSSRCRSSLDITMWCGNTWLSTPSLWEPCLVMALRVLLLLLVITMFTIQWEGCVSVRINKFKTHHFCYLGFYRGMALPQGTPTASSNQSLTLCNSLVSLLSRIEFNTHVMIKEIGDWINCSFRVTDFLPPPESTLMLYTSCLGQNCDLGEG